MNARIKKERRAMKRWKKYFLLVSLTGPTITLHSCSTILATSLRDAAVGGAATFVETATTDLLDSWFGSSGQE
jgi:hypothetical protein